MQLTQKNVGEVLIFPHNGSRILIEELNQGQFVYCTETGTRYASKEQNINACLVLDLKAIEEFKQNVSLGQVLAAAEKSAVNKILSQNISAQEKDEAKRVLNSTRKQREHFISRIAEEQKTRAASHSRLNDTIQSAEARRAEQKPRNDKEKTEHNR